MISSASQSGSTLPAQCSSVVRSDNQYRGMLDIQDRLCELHAEYVAPYVMHGARVYGKAHKVLVLLDQLLVRSAEDQIYCCALSLIERRAVSVQRLNH